MLSSTKALFVTFIIVAGDTSSCLGPRGGELRSDLMTSFRASALILREITIWGETKKSIAKNLRTKLFLMLVEYVARAEALET